MLVVCGCGNAASSTEPAEQAPIAPKIDEALAAIVATCAKCDGPVEVRRRGKPFWEPVAVGGTFRDGDWIRTGTGAAARVRFVSGGHLDLDEKTTLFVEADGGKDKVAAVHVAIQSGAATGELGGGDAPIKLRTSEGEVRLGADDRSEFRLSSTGDGKVDVAVNQGEVIVKRPGGERRIAAKVVEPVAVEPVKDPIDAPPVRPLVRVVPRPKPARIAFPSSVSPKVDAKLACSGLAIPLRWNAVPGATKYRVVVARDMSFRSVVLNQELPGTQTSFAPKGAGTYAWRVAARDARGYGEFGFARRIFCR